MSAVLPWLTWAAYVVVAVIVYRHAYCAFDAQHRAEFRMLSIESSDRAFFAIFSMCAALFCPIVVAACLVYLLLTPTTPGEKAENLREREERVRRMEREAGIR